jgi:hypothetical protein
MTGNITLACKETFQVGLKDCTGSQQNSSRTAAIDALKSQHLSVTEFQTIIFRVMPQPGGWASRSVLHICITQPLEVKIGEALYCASAPFHKHEEMYENITPL